MRKVGVAIAAGFLGGVAAATGLIGYRAPELDLATLLPGWATRHAAQEGRRAEPEGGLPLADILALPSDFEQSATLHRQLVSADQATLLRLLTEASELEPARQRQPVQATILTKLVETAPSRRRSRPKRRAAATTISSIAYSRRGPGRTPRRRWPTRIDCRGHRAAPPRWPSSRSRRTSGSDASARLPRRSRWCRLSNACSPGRARVETAKPRGRTPCREGTRDPSNSAPKCCGRSPAPGPTRTPAKRWQPSPRCRNPGSARPGLPASSNTGHDATGKRQRRGRWDNRRRLNAPGCWRPSPGWSRLTTRNRPWRSPNRSSPAARADAHSPPWSKPGRPRTRGPPTTGRGHDRRRRAGPRWSPNPCGTWRRASRSRRSCGHPGWAGENGSWRWMPRCTPGRRTTSALRPTG